MNSNRIGPIRYMANMSGSVTIRGPANSLSAPRTWRSTPRRLFSIDCATGRSATPAGVRSNPSLRRSNKRVSKSDSRDSIRREMVVWLTRRTFAAARMDPASAAARNSRKSSQFIWPASLPWLDTRSAFEHTLLDIGTTTDHARGLQTKSDRKLVG